MQPQPVPIYSSLFSTVYDQPGPTGYLGRGAHYSILRCAEWFDVELKRQATAHVHDFCVVWDEDHDRRVIDVVEAIYASGLLAPIQFIGERKGMVSILYAARFWSYAEDGVLDEWKRKINEICAKPKHGDWWSCEFGMFDRSPIRHQTEIIQIIADSEHNIENYLRGIDSTWKLGTRPYFQYQVPEPSPGYVI